MKHYVYIIQSQSTKKFYTGFTSNIERRIKEHNNNLSNTISTKENTDYELKFCQIVGNRIEVRMLEKYLKSGSGREIRGELIK